MSDTPPEIPAAKGRPPAIEVQNLHRHFGSLKAVDGVSFSVEPGQVVGFVGANGAGKTTTMRIIATLDYPNRGMVKVSGIDVVQYPALVRHRIGWMPDSFGTYDNMTVVEYLDFFARALGFKGAEREERVRDVIDFTDLTPLADRLINKLSKGMGQRLCLGRALIHDPDVLILDEPAAGLDPKARVELKHLIRILADDGKTVFISSTSVVSSVRPTTYPWISSVTSAPIMWAPRSSPVLASKTVLIIPSGSPSAIAFPLPMNGKRPTLT